VLTSKGQPCDQRQRQRQITQEKEFPLPNRPPRKRLKSQELKGGKNHERKKKMKEMMAGIGKRGQNEFGKEKTNEGRDQTHFTDLGEFEQSNAAFHHEVVVDLNPTSIFNLFLYKKGIITTGAKVDVFHILSVIWKTSTERCLKVCQKERKK
jgi:hypothetical protein